MYKQFRKKNYRGYIYDYDKYEGYYKVRYEDGDSAEYDNEEISKMLHKLDETNIDLGNLTNFTILKMFFFPYLLINQKLPLFSTVFHL